MFILGKVLIGGREERGLVCWAPDVQLRLHQGRAELGEGGFTEKVKLPSRPGQGPSKGSCRALGRSLTVEAGSKLNFRILFKILFFIEI